VRGDTRIIKALCVRFLSTGDCKAQTVIVLLSLITSQHHEEDTLEGNRRSDGPVISCV
jgi:hypothetical protein